MSYGVLSPSPRRARITPLKAALAVFVPLACGLAAAQSGTAPSTQPRPQFQLTPSVSPVYDPMSGREVPRAGLTGWATSSPRSAIGLSFDVSSPTGTGLMPSLRQPLPTSMDMSLRWRTQFSRSSRLDLAAWRRSGRLQAHRERLITRMQAKGIAPEFAERVLRAIAGPGIDAEKYFADRIVLNSGTVLEKLRTPLRSPDFAPVLQKVRDAKPDALFVFLPSGQGAAFMKQFAERGLDKAGIRLIGTGDITDDDQLNDMGDVALGVVTAHHYAASHKSAVNQKFVEAFKKANNGMRPNFMAVGGYDGIRVIVEGLKASKGEGGEKLLAAMKGQIFESPRGQVLIDGQTRDIVHDMYIRKVERVGGELQNVEFDAIKAMKDPGKK